MSTCKLERFATYLNRACWTFMRRVMRGAIAEGTKVHTKLLTLERDVRRNMLR